MQNRLSYKKGDKHDITGLPPGKIRIQGQWNSFVTVVQTDRHNLVDSLGHLILQKISPLCSNLPHCPPGSPGVLQCLPNSTAFETAVLRIAVEVLFFIACLLKHMDLEHISAAEVMQGKISCWSMTVAWTKSGFCKLCSRSSGTQLKNIHFPIWKPFCKRHHKFYMLCPTAIRVATLEGQFKKGFFQRLSQSHRWR